VDTELPLRPAWIIARLARQVELAAASMELTLPQYRVLIVLGAGSEAASALAEKLAVSRPSLTGVIDGLVVRGLVQRDGDPADRRRISLALTPAGRQLLAAADAEVERRCVTSPSTAPTAPRARSRGSLRGRRRSMPTVPRGGPARPPPGAVKGRRRERRRERRPMSATTTLTREPTAVHLSKMSFQFFDTVQSGQLISRANSDIRSVQMCLTSRRGWPRWRRSSTRTSTASVSSSPSSPNRAS
jgi:DNA-binding MarR family transcriptional regulator